MVACFLIVSQQSRLLAAADEQDVEIAVAVNVGECRPENEHRSCEIFPDVVFGNRREFGRLIGSAVPIELSRLLVVLARLNFVDVVFEMAVSRKQVGASVEIAIEEKQAESELESRRRSQTIRD